MEKWIFTFGCGQPNAGCYIVFEGTYEEARTKMVRAFGNKWSMQYEYGRKAEVCDEWNLKQIY